jgi:hypothetical protein
MVMKVVGYDVDQVSMITDDVRRTGHLNISYVYAKTEKRRPFVAAMSAARPENFSMTIIGDQGTISADMPTASSYYTRFFDQLLDMQRSFERRTQYQPSDVIRAKYQCLLAAYYSKMERNSSPVKVGSVPADWALPAWQPNWYDGSEFKR